MIGLDTNILLRATLNDDPVQSGAAQRLLKTLDENEGGFVNVPVLMEFFWILRSRYKLPQARLAAVMRDLLGFLADECCADEKCESEPGASAA